MRLQRLGLFPWASVAVLVLGAFMSASVAAARETGQAPNITAQKGDAAEPTKTQVEFMTAEQLKVRIAKNEPTLIVDVRSQSTFIASDKRVKGALHVNPRRLKLRARHFPRDREVVTYCSCRGDATSIRAARLLLEMGFKRVRALKGGWDAWLEAGGQVEPRLGSATSYSSEKRP